MIDSFLRCYNSPAMKKIDLGSSHSFSTIIRLMLPAMAAQLVSVLYSVVDRIYVGNIAGYGALALVGVGIASPITTLISSFAFWVGLGGAPLFSMSLGEKREDNAKKILSNAFLMLMVFSLVIGLLFFIFLKPMLYAFGASEESYPYAYSYMSIYLIGTLFSILTYGLNQFLTAQGDSLLAMATTTIACLLNVGLDPLFIYTFNLGVEGAAIATVICQFISCLLALGLLTFKTKIRLSFGHYDLRVMGKILKLGFSPFIITCTDSLVLIALNSVLSLYGKGNGDFYIEVATIVTAFETLVTGPLLGISSGTQPILGYNYGAKNIPLIKKAEKQITLCGLVFTSLCFALSFFFAEPFARLFLTFSSSSADKEATIATAAEYIHVYMYGIIPFLSNMSLSMA
jgi:putative MATE family efflux protein